MQNFSVHWFYCNIQRRKRVATETTTTTTTTFFIFLNKTRGRQTDGQRQRGDRQTDRQRQWDSGRDRTTERWSEADIDRQADRQKKKKNRDTERDTQMEPHTGTQSDREIYLMLTSSQPQSAWVKRPACRKENGFDRNRMNDLPWNKGYICSKVRSPIHLIRKNSLMIFGRILIRE